MINQLQDVHKDKLCFVLGTGPSLRKVEVEILRPYIIVATVGTILKFPFAQYYITRNAGDPLRIHWQILKYLDTKLILYREKGLRHFQQQRSEAGFGDIYEGIDPERCFYFSLSGSERSLYWLHMLSNNALIGGGTSVHAATHFAHKMGCNPIILLGCDCQYHKGKKYFYDFDDQPSEGYITPEMEEFILKNYEHDAGSIIKGADRLLRFSIHQWKLLKDRNPDIEIIDASEGKLTMFPQMSLKEVLKKYI